MFHIAMGNMFIHQPPPIDRVGDGENLGVEERLKKNPKTFGS